MDRDYLIDLALSMAQDCADEWHGKEAIEGIESQLKIINKDEMPELHAKLTAELEEERADWLEGVWLRRLKMDVLGVKSPNYQYHKRCALKHRATAFVLAVETYQADPDEMTLRVMHASEKRFWKALCQFMGVEKITNCGRCLSDQLRVAHSKEWCEQHGYAMSVGETPKS